MQKDALQRDLLTSDEIYTRYHYHHEGMEARDLATVKDLFALHRYELRQDYNETYGRFD
jgi:hypothetical protein